MAEIECLKDGLDKIIFSALAAVVLLCFHSHAQGGSQNGKWLELPDICSVVMDEDIAQINPFSNPLSRLFPDPNSHETYSGCHYEFFTPDEKPGIAVRLIKWSSKEEAVEDFKMQEKRASEWPQPPEPVEGAADLAYFNYDGEDPSLCNECSLVAVRKEYGVFIALKGQYEKVSRSKKKDAALKILKLLRERIPELK